MLVELWHQQCPPVYRKGEPWFWRQTEHQVVMPLRLDDLARLFKGLTDAY